jgi:SAM-dependent methyltransferase
MKPSLNLADLQAISAMPRYYAWKADLARPYLGPRVLEIGCGTGLMLERLGPRPLLAGVDSDAEVIAIARRRMAGRPGVRLRHLDVLAPVFPRLKAWRPSSIVFCSALEVIRDDRRALGHAAAILRPGGRVVVFASAVPSLAGPLDGAFGQRRYGRAGLRARLEEAGFSIRCLRYVNLLGVLGMLWDNAVVRRRSVPESAYRSRDLVVPVARLLDAVTGPPLGRSLFAVGVKRRPSG